MNQLLALIFFLIFSSSLKSQTLKPEQWQAIDQLVKAEVKEGAPGLALGIVRKGEVIYSGYAGLANLEDQIVINEQSRFNIASCGKQFTAICILKLIADKKLKLEDDIRTYLPDLFPMIKTPITIAHLLNHSSGIRDVYDLWALQGIVWWKRILSNKDAIQLLSQQQELNFPPGSKHLYSNSNYLLLAEIIKVVTQMKFQSYTDSLFASLDMPNTSFSTNYMKVIPHKAHPFGFWKEWLEYPWISNLYGDGALFTNLPDQLHWEQILQSKKTKALTTEIIETSQQAIQNTSIAQYGFGLEFGEYRGFNSSYHNGNTGAWNSSIIRFPEEDLAIVAMSNNANISPYQLSRKCADLVIDKSKLMAEEFPRGPKELGPEIPSEELVGTYRTPGGFFFKIVEQAGDLYLERYGRNAIRIVLESGNLYHEETDPDFKQAFVKDPEKGYQLTAYYPSHHPYTLTKIEANWENYPFAALNGDYSNQEVDTQINIQHLESDRYRAITNGQELEAQMYAPDILLLGDYTVRVIRERGQWVKELRVDNNRIRNIRFERLKEVKK